MPALARRLASATAFVAAAACAPSGPSPSEEVRGDPSADPEPRFELFGDDRVAEVLRRDPSAAPRTYAEHEILFGIGRSCRGVRSREIFVIEERATRIAERVVPTDRPVPRVVVTGCSGAESSEGAGSAEANRISAEIFTVVPTDPARPREDPLLPAPIEVIARDLRTGSYSFYVFDDAGVTRVVRDRDRVRSIFGGRDGSSATTVESGPRCFGCHVAGGPIMPAAADPWTGWISGRTPRATSAFAGETAAIVAESVGTSGRRGHADALEQIVRNATRALVFAAGDEAIARFRADHDPRSIEALLRAVFCEVELEWASASPRGRPLPLFVDPGAMVGIAFDRPAGAAGPVSVPIRGEWDRRVEDLLVTRGLLRPETVLSLRLVDDRNDVFSEARCALLPQVLASLDRDRVGGAALDAVVRAHVRRALAGEDPAAVYGRALLDQDGSDAARTALEVARAAFADRVRARIAELGDDELEALAAVRRVAARRLFPADAHPIPVP
jgi:hypothetical protein